MSRGERRNAELSRAVLVAAAGAAALGVSQADPQLSEGLAGLLFAAVGGVAVVAALVLAWRALSGRPGDQDR